MGSPRALKGTGPFVCWPKRPNDTLKRSPKAAVVVRAAPVVWRSRRCGNIGRRG